MNKRMIMLMAAALALLSASGQVSFTGVGGHPVYEVTPEANTDLNKIFVVYNTDGVGMTFNSSTGERATWESFYYNNGNLVMEPVTDIRWNGMGTTLNRVIPNIGYKIQEGNNHPYYCWVVNYADYTMELNDMFLNEDSSCDLLSFIIDGHADPITYYTVDGLPRVLDRELKLTYKTLELDTTGLSIGAQPRWKEVPVTDTFPSLAQGVSIAPPLCETNTFVLTGDRFLEYWNEAEGCTTDLEDPNLVGLSAKMSAVVQDPRDDRFERESNGRELSGSAPRHIVFTGYPSDGVVYRAWEMATDPEFQNIILQYNQDVVDYTFDEWGTYYMRYVVNNAAGTCPVYGEDIVTGDDYYTIAISESQLECSNILLLDSTPNEDHMWKVSYKSLVEFHCWIFNRWGNLVYEYTDPGGGWDGTYRGQLVDTGVYYYVISAKGSDGKVWDSEPVSRGSITTVRYKGGSSPEGAGGLGN